MSVLYVHIRDITMCSVRYRSVNFVNDFSRCDVYQPIFLSSMPTLYPAWWQSLETTSGKYSRFAGHLIESLCPCFHKWSPNINPRLSLWFAVGIASRQSSSTLLRYTSTSNPIILQPTIPYNLFINLGPFISCPKNYIPQVAYHAIKPYTCRLNQCFQVPRLSVPPQSVSKLRWNVLPLWSYARRIVHSVYTPPQ